MPVPKHDCPDWTPVEFNIVAGKVLIRNTDPSFSGPDGDCRGKFPAQERIFGMIFKVATAKGSALNVHSGCEPDIHMIEACLPADSPPEISGKFRVPARSQQRGVGPPGGGLSKPKAGRTIGGIAPGNPECRRDPDRTGSPRDPAGPSTQEMDQVLIGKLIEKILDQSGSPLL